MDDPKRLDFLIADGGSVISFKPANSTTKYAYCPPLSKMRFSIEWRDTPKDAIDAAMKITTPQ